MNNTEEQVKILQEKIVTLERRLNLLESTTTIPFSVEQAFRSRLEIDTLAQFEASAKSATSENQAVNEGGSASYSVLKAPDGFRQNTSGGTTFYIPYYT